MSKFKTAWNRKFLQYYYQRGGDKDGGLRSFESPALTYQKNKRKI